MRLNKFIVCAAIVLGAADAAAEQISFPLTYAIGAEHRYSGASLYVEKIRVGQAVEGSQISKFDGQLRSFVASLKDRDCEKLIERTDPQSLISMRVSKDQWCEALRTSFSRFGDFAVDSYFYLSGTFVAILKPAKTGEQVRALTFRKLSDRWVFSEAQTPGSLVPALLSAIRQQSTLRMSRTVDVSKERKILLEDNGALGKVMMGHSARSGAAAGMIGSLDVKRALDFYRTCVAPESGREVFVDKYSKCLEGEAAAFFKKEYLKSDSAKRDAIVAALSGQKKIVGYLLGDGVLTVFYRDERANIDSRDVVRIDGGSFALENPMKSSSIDLLMRTEAFGASLVALN